MSENIPSANSSRGPSYFYSLTAVVAAFAGLADSAYLTAKHFSGSEVPCSVISGCEQVLTSPYAEILGVPTALYGAAAYFGAFSLALLSAYGYRRLWNAFGALSGIMAAATLWFLYLQAFVIGAFCQFCLLSAITSFALLVVYLASKYFRTR